LDSSAREKRDEARKLLADGIDPSAERQERRTALLETFEGVAEEWLELQSKSLAPETISILGSRLKSALYPYVGSKPVAAITAQEVLTPAAVAALEQCTHDLAKAALMAWESRFDEQAPPFASRSETSPTWICSAAAGRSWFVRCRPEACAPPGSNTVRADASLP
jgi:hypothetical protein